MATIRIEATAGGVDRVAEEFSKLSLAQQKAVLSGTQVEESLKKTGSAGKSAFGSMAKEALSFAAGMAGVNSVTSIFQKIIASAKEDFRQLTEMQKAAAGAQQSMADAVGTFVANNPQLNEQQVQQWKDFAAAQGEALGAGGAPRVMAAATALRSRTPGFSDQQQAEALQVGVSQARIDRSTDIASFAAATLKIQESMGGSIQQAANILAIFGARAGGDVATLADEVGKLKAVAATTGTPMDKVLSMFGFLTGEMDDPTGKETSTVLRNLLARVNTREIELGGKYVQFAPGMDAADKLKDIIGRIQGGEFGDAGKALTQLTGELGRESASALAAVGAIGTAPQRLAESEAMVRQAGQEGVSIQQAQLGVKQRVVLGAEGMAATRAAAGAAEQALEGDTVAAERERVRQRLASFQEQYGITTGFDYTKGGREYLATIGETNPLEFERQEQIRMLQRKAREALPVGGGGSALFGLLGTSAAAPGAGVEAREAAAASPFAGIQTPEEILRRAVQLGAVSPEGGISSFEAEALKTVGIDERTIAEWNRLFLDGLTERLTEAMTQALRNAQMSGGPNALNPGA